MKAPIDWLKEYVDFDAANEVLEKTLTMHGLEVEEITSDENGDVINIELTPNRGDCASIIGITRELSAYFKSGYKIPETSYSETGDPVTSKYNLVMEIPDKCPMYYLKYIRDVKIKESPEWLQKRLKAAGVRPLNNVIDITNYVMLELGQPLHAFDAEKISGNTVKIRNAADKEELLTLDGQSRKLNKEDIVIADSEIPIALGGIMGGEHSAVSDTTKDILLESAYFMPNSISRSERKLELKTESSYRFTRNVDPGTVKTALERATHLIEKICKGKPAPEVLENRTIDIEKRVIHVDLNTVNKILGSSITLEQASELLRSLEFEVTVENSMMTVKIPLYRNDISRPIDVTEEIARMYGYKNIEASLPESGIVTELSRERDYLKTAEEILFNHGFWEAVTHTIISGDLYSKLPESEEFSAVEIDNPININMNILRPNLLFGLLDVCKYNINQKQSPIRFFERGPVFQHVDIKKYSERPQIGFIALTDDFFESKNLVVSILENLCQEFDINYNNKSSYFEKDMNASISINGNFAGEFGILSRNLLKSYKLSNLKFIGGYIFTDILEKDRILNKKFIKWSQFPSIFRDLSLVVPVELTHVCIYDKIKSNAGEFFKDIKLYDIYQDEKFGEDKKSMTYTLEFNSKDRTLTSDEIDICIEKILAVLNTDFGITLRPE
jgi:phenylalanyl-tRNA synthetase beta chain